MEARVALPLVAAALALTFAGLVLAQWRVRRQAFQMAWAVGLGWYGLAALAEAMGGLFGWSEPLYRAWYLAGGLFVAAYLGLGTVYLLRRTRFGHVVAVAILAGGLFALLAQRRLVSEGRPAPDESVWSVIVFAALASLAIAYVTARHRTWTGHIVLLTLLAASAYATAQLLLAPIDAPGYSVDPRTGVPQGTAIPSHVRVMTGPFNIAGAVALIGGAVYSMYVFMPKRKVLRPRTRVPVLREIAGAAAVVVNLVASLPLVVDALRAGRLHSRVPATLLIALGALVPSITSGLGRFGITWGHFFGEALGILLIFAGFLVSTEVFGERLRLGRWTVLRREVSAGQDA